MAGRPESDLVGAGAGRSDPDSPGDETIRLDALPERESHSVHEAVPGTPAGLPPIQRDANIQGGSASTLQGPHPSTSSTIPGRAMDAPPIVSQTGLPAQSSATQSVESAAGLHPLHSTSDGTQLEPPPQEATPARGMLPLRGSVRLGGPLQGPPTISQELDTDRSARYASARSIGQFQQSTSEVADSASARAAAPPPVPSENSSRSDQRTLPMGLVPPHQQLGTDPLRRVRSCDQFQQSASMALDSASPPLQHLRRLHLQKIPLSPTSGLRQ